MQPIEIVTCLLIFLLPSCIQSLKCDQVVKEQFPEILSYLGNVTFTAPGPAPTGNWTLFMKTTAPFTFIGGWDVWIESDGPGSKATFHNVDIMPVKKGDEITFRFRIHYAPPSSSSHPLKNVPHVKSLAWEKWTLCQSQDQGLGQSQGPTTYSKPSLNFVRRRTLRKDNFL